MKANYYKRQSENVKDDKKKAWKTDNKILNRDKKSSDTNCMNFETREISSPTEFVKCFNNYFTNIDSTIANNIDGGDANFRDYVTNTSSIDSIFKLFQCQSSQGPSIAR